MSVIKEFREFAVRGNVADLAVGVIMGAAFGKLVTSLVNDVLMPPLGILVDGVSFTHLSLVLKPGSMADGKAIAPVTLNYGAFLQNILDLFLVSLAVFVLVKGINRLRRQAPPPPAPAPPREVELLTEIRDALRKG